MNFAWPWMFLLLPLPWLAWRFLPPAAPGAALHLPQPVVLAQRTAAVRIRDWRAWVAAVAWALLEIGRAHV